MNDILLLIILEDKTFYLIFNRFLLLQFLGGASTSIMDKQIKDKIVPFIGYEQFSLVYVLLTYDVNKIEAVKPKKQPIQAFSGLPA